MAKNQDTKVVTMSKKTHDRLGEIGKKNEKYGAIVERLIDTVEMYEKMYGKIEVSELNGS